jgi:hypothetical protein
MTKRLVCGTFLVALVLSVGAGCQLSPSSELYGTWTLVSGGVTESLTFGLMTFTIEDAGALTGKLKCNLTQVDETNRAIKLTASSSSGIWDGTANNTKLYMKYEIIGDSFYFDMDTSWPISSNAYGPYIKE